MYEVLIAHLRECAKLDPSNNTYTEAADAIEEMSADCDMYRKGMTDEHNKAARLLWDKEHCWIPVTERLPDNIDEEVLVCNEGYGKDGTGFATVAVYNGNGWLECWERKTYLTAVTHWMPLPQPPKEVNTDGQ